MQPILCIPPVFDGCGHDVQIWGGTSNGIFSVKFAYNSLVNFSEVCNSPWKIVWTLNIPPKLKTFLWLAAHGKLLTNVQRLKRKLISDPLALHVTLISKPLSIYSEIAMLLSLFGKTFKNLLLLLM